MTKTIFSIFINFKLFNFSFSKFFIQTFFPITTINITLLPLAWGEKKSVT